MNQLPISLKEVDRVEILTLMDNYVDVLLQDTEIVTRLPKYTGEEIPTDTILSEHGLSLLITVFEGENSHRILFDSGYTRVGVPHNMAQLGIDVKTIEAIVISHAHMDHTGSLYRLLEDIPNTIPLVVHPDAFLSPRYVELDSGERKKFPRTLVKEDLERKRVEVLESRNPVPIADGRVLVTGEVERTTDFEKGLPGALIERHGKIEGDPILDDQSIAINLKDKGLVVISGCSHAGIINTVLYSNKMTGVQNTYAVLGGFHLTGSFLNPLLK